MTIQPPSPSLLVEVSSRGTTTPQGFRAAGVSAGIKTSGALDVALVVNDGPSHAAAGVFTRNRVQAAPVRWSRQVLTDGIVRAVVLNSGGANACTGEAGYADTRASAAHVGALLTAPADHVAVCSTGLIGERLPMDRLLPGIERAYESLDRSGGGDAATAIMTTDTVPKCADRSGGGVSVGGMAKGAGMLAPGLATMLAVITTDAEASREQLNRVLATAADRTFDRLDSDGCMSTNDTVLLLSSGATGLVVPDDVLEDLVTSVCADLSRQLISDAEGASKEIEICVTGAASVDDAVCVGREVARSNLFKCAVHGEDPNWGRVLSAVGTTTATFDPDMLAVWINGVCVARNGIAGDDLSLVDMRERRVRVDIDLGAGGAEGSVWTNDLTAAYVHENSAYSS